jgi:predicted branched-subunit amino acid permease
MTTESHTGAPAPYWTLSGLVEGTRRCGAMIPGTFVFAAAYGTLAAQKGLTLTEAVLMSAIVFGGSAQLVALEVWNAPITPATVLSLTVVTAIVNSRLILMGATLRPWLKGLPDWQAYAALSTTVDATWLIGIRYRGEGGGDVSVFAGAGLTLWVVWVASALPGYMLGAFISDPKRFGFDLVLIIFFAAMLVPLWRGGRRAIGWAAGGAVALVVSYIVPGWWFIVAGALSGSIVGAFVDE